MFLYNISLETAGKLYLICYETDETFFHKLF